MLLACLSSACSTLFGKNMQQQVASLKHLPNKVILDVPMIAQQQYYCGPASIGMVLAYLGIEKTQTAIANQVFLPRAQGVLPPDISAYIRQQQLLAYHIPPRLEALISELAAGRAVLVLQNLSFEFYPKWHYAVLIGYDIKRRKLYLNSGEIANYELSFSTFLRTWQRADFFNIVALRQNNDGLYPLPATDDGEGYLRAIADLDQLNLLPNAIAQYRDYLKHWPKQHLAWFYLGNHLYAKKQYFTALEAFKNAFQYKENADYLNNLAHVAAELGCTDLYQQAAKCAATKELNSSHLTATLHKPPAPKFKLPAGKTCPQISCSR